MSFCLFKDRATTNDRVPWTSKGIDLPNKVIIEKLDIGEEH